LCDEDRRERRAALDLILPAQLPRCRGEGVKIVALLHKRVHISFYGQLGMGFRPVMRRTDKGEICGENLESRVANCAPHRASRAFRASWLKEDDRKGVEQVAFGLSARVGDGPGSVVCLQA
jgi:hypothetical protein